MTDKLKEAWDEAERTGERIDIGRSVACDSCNEDFTDSAAQGGFIFQSNAYCPDCATNALQRIRGYGEERFIRATCPDGVSFADFVRDYRGPNAFIQIIPGAR